MCMLSVCMYIITIYILIYRCEYYSMVYLRHTLSIQYFPRIVFILLVGYHIYIYSHPEGFAFPALAVLYFMIFYFMIYTVRKYELAVYVTGVWNEHTTRGRNNRVLNDIHHTQLAPEYSMFMWINHQEEVPDLLLPDPPTATINTTHVTTPANTNNNIVTIPTIPNNNSNNNNTSV